MSDGSRRTVLGIAPVLGLLLGVGTSFSAPPPRDAIQGIPLSLVTAEQIREAELAAEARSDWEAAFSLQCRLLLTDRSPAVREKTSTLLRRAQQSRRHRDPAFTQFVEKLSVTEALNLYTEVVTKLPTLYADREKAALPRLWKHGIEEFDRALMNPAFVRVSGPDAIEESRLTAFRASLRKTWESLPATNAKEARNNLRRLAMAATDAGVLRKPTAVVVEFLCGACTGLDDYTVFLTPAQASLESASLTDLQQYGIFTTISEHGLRIQGLIPNSWAALHSSLVPGDRIVRVNGRLFDPGSPAELIEALRNPPGAAHRLEIAGPVPDMLPTVMLPLAVPTVYGSQVLNPKDGIAYLRLGAFRDTTARELDDALELLKNQGARSLVLDLRGNHGGLFNMGLQVTQRFLPAGIIVTTQGQTGDWSQRVFSSDSGMMAWDLPMVLLIDGETASAAEVVAGALKDHQRATLVGMTTFGKGSIQFPVRLESLDDPADPNQPRARSGMVRLTIARFSSPRGAAVSGQGIAPQILEPDPLRQLEIALIRASELAPPTSMPIP